MKFKIMRSTIFNIKNQPEIVKYFREEIQCFITSCHCFICTSKDSAYTIHYSIHSPETFADSRKTLIYFPKTLAEVDETLGEVNKTSAEVDKTLGEVNKTLAEVDRTLGEVNETLAEVVETLIYFPKTFNYAKQSIINK